MDTDFKCVACGEPLPIRIPAIGVYYGLCPVCGMELTFRKKQDFIEGDKVKLLHTAHGHVVGEVGTVMSVDGFSRYNGYNYIPPFARVRFSESLTMEESIGKGVTVPEYSLARIGLNDKEK